MRKYLNISLVYAIAAMCCGVFYREFTKFNGFEGATVLGKAHTHLFLLGMFVFLIAALFSKSFDFKGNNQFKAFMILHNIGVPLMAIMMIVRGVFQVLGTELSKGLDAAVSGIAGLSHILVAGGIIFLILALKKCALPQNSASQ